MNLREVIRRLLKNDFTFYRSFYDIEINKSVIK